MADLVETLRLACDDPMWADHVEMPKKLLRHAIDRLESLKAENEEQRERLVQFTNAFDAGYAAAERALAERAGGGGKQDAIDFLYKHGALTHVAAREAVELLTSNGFEISRRSK